MNLAKSLSSRPSSWATRSWPRQRPSPTGSLPDWSGFPPRSARCAGFSSACLALLVLLVGGLGAALAGTLSQMSDLTDQVAALSERTPANSTERATPQPAASASAAPAVVEQMGAAPPLDGAVVLPGGVDKTGAVLIGDPNADNVVEVYIDYQCPFCQRWEAQVGSALIDAAVKPGSGLLIKQYAMAFLGETSPTLTPAGASARAASAAACVIDGDGTEVFIPFSRSLFAAADPREPAGQFPVEQLTVLAKQAGASPETVSCIEAGTHVPFVAATTQAAFARGVSGTPTVVFNGRTLGNAFTDESLAPLAAGG